MGAHLGVSVGSCRVPADLFARNGELFCGPSLGESPAGQSVFRQEGHATPYQPTCVGPQPSHQVRAAGSSQLLTEATGEKEEEGAV